MSKKADYKLGMKEYDMENYWNRRAEFFGEDEYKAICVFSASKEMNMLLDRLQGQVFSSLLRIPGNLAGKRVLEIGCGVGRWADLLNDKGASYAGIDISQKMVDVAKKRVPKAQFFKMSGDALDFGDESFDLVFSVTCLQHIPYEEQCKAVKEMWRVTRSEGHIVIIEDTKRPEGSFNMFSNSSHRWRKLFEGYGCETICSVKHKTVLAVMLYGALCNLTPDRIHRKVITLSCYLESLLAFLPERYFSGVGLVFRKVEVLSTRGDMEFD